MEITKTISGLEIILVPDPNSGFTAFFKKYPNMISEGETKEEAIDRLFEIYKIVKAKETATQFEALVQSYLGMTPADKGCKNWREMQDKMIEEIAEILEDAFDLKESQ